MISLVAIAGIHIPGCLQSAALPPALSIPNAAYPAPGAWGYGQGPRNLPQPAFQFLQPKLPALAENLWQPNVPPREWQYIVIHHTAGSRGSVQSIHESHLQRKDKLGNPWQGIGYHFVIGNGSGMADGEIESTFRWREQMQGAHAGDREYNHHGIGIALIGNFDEEPPTAAQLDAVKRLVAALKGRFGISSENVIGHGEIKATACPGQYFPMAEVSLSEKLLGRLNRDQTIVNLVGLEGNRKR